MRKFLFFICFILSALRGVSQYYTHQIINTVPCPSNNNMGGFEFGIIDKPIGYGGGTKYATIVFFNGKGEGSATDPNKVINSVKAGGPQYFVAQGLMPTHFTNPITNTTEDILFITCQYPDLWGNLSNDLDQIIPYLISHFDIDPNRLHLTGISAGGGGMTRYSMGVSENLSSIVETYKPATIAPASAEISEPSDGQVNKLKADGVHTWAMGDDDGAPPTDIYGTIMHHLTTKLGPLWSVFTMMHQGHDFWDSYYYNPNFRQSVTVGGVTKSLNYYEWVLAFSRSGSQVPLSVNAGSDKTVPYPGTTVNLDGTEIPATSHNITSRVWTKVSGPGTTLLSNATTLHAVASQLQAGGTYTFQLTATQDDAQTAFDQMVVVVNSACGTAKHLLSPTANHIQLNSSDLSYLPGDTLLISHNGNNFYDYIFLQGFEGNATCPLTVINQDSVKVTGNFDYDNCRFINMRGSGNGYTYGFYFSDPAHWPADLTVDNSLNPINEAIHIEEKSSDIDVSGVNVYKKRYAFVVKNEASCDSTINQWVLNNIGIHDNKSVLTLNQFGYLGSTDIYNFNRPIVCNGDSVFPTPSRLGNFKIYNNYMDSAGRPGIQLSGASTGISLIYNNTIKHIGREHNEQQGVGIALGSATRARVYGNTIISTYTWNIAATGALLADIGPNTMDSAGYVDGTTVAISSGWTTGPANILVDNRLEPMPIDSVQFMIHGNIMNHNYQTHAIEVNNGDNAWPYNLTNGNVLCGNVYNGSPAVFSVHAGINYSTDCSIYSGYIKFILKRVKNVFR